MSTDNGFDRAQRQYDKQMPPEEPDAVECEECEGEGKVWDDGAPDAVMIPCPKCKGQGEIIPEPRDYDPREDDDEPFHYEEPI